MIRHTQKIPHGVSDYIRNRFREDFLFEVKEAREVNGHLQYRVEVTKDDYLHSLKFNEKGALLAEEAVHTFPPDIHDQPAFDDTPE
jgi:hypothetical protein